MTIMFELVLSVVVVLVVVVEVVLVVLPGAGVVTGVVVTTGAEVVGGVTGGVGILMTRAPPPLLGVIGAIVLRLRTRAELSGPEFTFAVIFFVPSEPSCP